MSGNNENRVENSYANVSGILVGENLIKELKNEMMKEKVFQIMFGGEKGSRIYDNYYPNINETILPFALVEWKKENFKSFNVYFEGTISMTIALPVNLDKKIGHKRKVGLIFQRFLGGPLNLFDKVPGLISFGYGTDFNYEGVAKMDGFSAPAIQLTIPFKFDLQKLRADNEGFDPFASLDEADVGELEGMVLDIFKSEDNESLNVGVQIETGQTN